MNTNGCKNYQREAQKGIENESLQRSLRNLHNRLGKGAMEYWRSMADKELRERVKKRRIQTLENLDNVLELLSENVQKAGGHVYFAKTAEEAVNYCLRVAKKNEVKRVIKGKSMVSAEIKLDAALTKNNIEFVETDLGEYIIQLADDRPSHIIAPCVHLDRKNIGYLFSEKLGVEYSEDPEELTQTARKALRENMLQADMGITGCNIGCAETGKITLVSNEGNIRMATTMTKVHVALMGIERVAANMEDHQSMLQLLTQGAALQKLTTYVSFMGGPSIEGDPDGPEEFHLVLVDNGRSKILGDEEFREVLACIRCGACLNICPVYGKIGGHAYNSPYPGPIGAVISPLLFGINEYSDLCKGESLCGACLDVCPVQNDLPRMLLGLREKLAYGDRKWQVEPNSFVEAMGFKMYRIITGNTFFYKIFLKCARLFQLPFITKNGMISKMLGAGAKWTEDRDLQPLAKEPFSKRWKRVHSKTNLASRNQVKESGASDE